MSQAADLRHSAQTLAAPLPALLAQADHLAQTVLLGEHGRRRAGMGDHFWQYRPAQPGDSLRAIDWRRSARSDDTFVQDKEWQIAQSVMLWVDQGASMRFTSDDNRADKADRARTLALATAIVLNKAGERIGLAGADMPPRRGPQQITQIAQALIQDQPLDSTAPDTDSLPPNARALFIGDFLGDIAPLTTALTKAADRGIHGALLQVLDPQEEAFPFHGRTVFQSMSGQITHETLQAKGLRDRYLDRLAARKDALRDLARSTGWQFHTHHTDAPAAAALMWIYQTLARA